MGSGADTADRVPSAQTRECWAAKAAARPVEVPPPQDRRRGPDGVLGGYDGAPPGPQHEFVVIEARA